MKKAMIFVLNGAVVVFAASSVLAQQTPWGAVLKSAGQAAAQTAIQQMSPQAQATMEQAKKVGTGAPQENFILTKAKEFLAAGNYQPALDLATYVVTTLNSKSIDGKKIMADAQAALTKMAKDKLAQTPAGQAGQAGQAKLNTAQQVKTDATQTVTGIKSLFGSQK